MAFSSCVGRLGGNMAVNMFTCCPSLCISTTPHRQRLQVLLLLLVMEVLPGVKGLWLCWLLLLFLVLQALQQLLALLLVLLKLTADCVLILRQLYAIHTQPSCTVSILRACWLLLLLYTARAVVLQQGVWRQRLSLVWLPWGSVWRQQVQACGWYARLKDVAPRRSSNSCSCCRVYIRLAVCRVL